MRLIQEPGQLLTGRFSAITNDSASGSNNFENIIPSVPLTHEHSRIKVLSVRMLKAREGIIFLKIESPPGPLTYEHS